MNDVINSYLINIRWLANLINPFLRKYPERSSDACVKINIKKHLFVVYYSTFSSKYGRIIY